MRASELVKNVCHKEVKMLMNGAECEFVGSCAFYLKILSGDSVEFDLKINPLVREEYIDRMQDLGVEIEGRQKGAYNISYFCRPMEKIMSYSIKKSSTDWLFDVFDNQVENSHVGHGSGSGYIPLVAYFAVSKMLSSEGGKLKLVTRLSDYDVYLNLIMLKKYGNKLVSDLVEIENCNLEQADWTAYVRMQKSFGRMVNESDGSEKEKWLKDNDVQRGDVLLLYEIGKGANISNRELTSCHMVIIESYDGTGVQFKYIGTTELVLTQIERVSKTGYIQKTVKEYQDFYKQTRSIPYTNLGIEYLTCEEEYMLMLPTGDDVSCQLMILPGENGKWELRQVVLDTLETIYAVLENRGIKYNKERFLKKYFDGRVPYYERFRKHQPIRYENLTNAKLLEKYGEDAE